MIIEVRRKCLIKTKVYFSTNSSCEGQKCISDKISKLCGDNYLARSRQDRWV